MIFGFVFPVTAAVHYIAPLCNACLTTLITRLRMIQVSNINRYSCYRAVSSIERILGIVAWHPSTRHTTHQASSSFTFCAAMSAVTAVAVQLNRQSSCVTRSRAAAAPSLFRRCLALSCIIASVQFVEVSVSERVDCVYRSDGHGPRR
jgi:hypothetical protein